MKPAYILVGALFLLLAVIVAVNSHNDPELAAAYTAGGVGFLMGTAKVVIVFLAFGFVAKLVKQLVKRFRITGISKESNSQ